MSDLHRAAALGETELVCRIVRGTDGAPVDAILSEEHLLKKTPLHLAASGLHEEIVRTLLCAAKKRNNIASPPPTTAEHDQTSALEESRVESLAASKIELPLAGTVAVQVRERARQSV